MIMNSNPPEALKNEVKEKLLDTIELIIANKINLIEGSRRVINLASRAGIIEDKVFLPLIGFESQTDQFPTGEVRKRFNKDYLKQLDREQQEYIDEFKDSIVEACQTKFKKYSAKHNVRK